MRKKIRNRIQKAHESLPAKDYPFPLYVIVEPTNICNLACEMCPSPKQSRLRGIMSMDIWKKIMDEVAEISPDSLVWPAIMGEALTAGDAFIDMLEYAHQKNLKVIWNTNAILLNDEWIQRIMASGLQEIIIGLDAVSEEVYRRVRIGGDFHKAVENACKLLERNNGKTRVTMQFIEQDSNARETESFKQFWLAQGAVVKVRPRLGWGNAVETPNLVLQQGERMGPCPWIIRTVSIHWNGIVVQCDGDWDQQWPAGDLSEQSLEEIWNGELAKRRQRHRNMDFDFEPCRDCKDWQAGLSEFFYPEKAEHPWQRMKQNYFVKTDA